MGAPIVIGQQKSPLEGLLLQMYLKKYTHNMDMDYANKALAQKKLDLEEKRNYQEKTQLGKEGRANTSKIDTENRSQVNKYLNNGWYTKDQIKDPVRRLNGKTKMVGDQELYYPDTPNETETHTPVWGDDKWTMEKKAALKAYVHPKDPNAKPVYLKPGQKPPTGYLPYSSPLVTINTKPSIGEKQKQTDFAYLNSPKFIADVAKGVSQLNKFDWEMWDANERESAVKKEADKRMRISFPNSQYGVQNGKTGWYVKEGNEYKLVAPWSK